MVPRNDDLRRPPLPKYLSVQSTVSKYSFRSHTSSFNADDEFSSTDPSDSESGSMTPRASIEEDGRSRSGAYPGEDTRPTSTKELHGFYVYGFAAEVYVICGE